MQNTDAGMTKQTYYEMCDQLGNDPEDGEVPLDYDDLLKQTQQALILFQYLPDKWDSMGGGYLGKDLSAVKFYIEILSILDVIEVIDLLTIIINYRVESVNKKIQRKAKRSN